MYALIGSLSAELDDLLDDWQAEYLPEAKGLRVVGHQWSPRSHEVKDFLAANLVPYRWLDLARAPDAQRLLDAAGVAHKDGHIAEDATPPFCDETTTKKAVEMVRAQFGDACEHYLKTITTYNAASWPGIEQLVVLNP